MKLANLQLHLLLSTDCELAFSFLTFKHRCCHRTTGRNNVAVFVLSFDYGSTRQVYIYKRACWCLFPEHAYICIFRVLIIDFKETLHEIDLQMTYSMSEAKLTHPCLHTPDRLDG